MKPIIYTILTLAVIAVLYLLVIYQHKVHCSQITEYCIEGYCECP